MFTGLIQDIGRVTKVEQQDKGLKLRIVADNLDLSREKIGASISCSGCCLTATEISGQQFSVEVSAESLSKTHIGDWKEGVNVNLEPSLRMGDELGGHFVFGHIDGLATLTSIKEDGESYRMTIKPPSELMKFIAPKGSITLDGISLTVNEVSKDSFGVNIIPHTWEHTTLQHRKKGDKIHIEIDMLARYVQRMIGHSA